jgi:UDP-glucose 4-epimerase
MGVAWIAGDLLALDSEARRAIEQFLPECCVHLAWAGLPDYSLDKCQDNLRAGAQWFQFLRDIGCRRIISAGSCWEYGTRTGPVDELTPGFQVNLFAAHKNALREIGQSLLLGAECELIWVRIFFVYGLRQRPTSLIPTAIRAMKHGEAPQIGTPGAINDFVHVQDVASALRCLVEQAHASGIYNIGSGRPASVAEVVNAIASETGRPHPYPHTSNHAAGGFWADIQRIGALGWSPAHTLQSGIAQVVRDWDKTE